MKRKEYRCESGERVAGVNSRQNAGRRGYSNVRGGGWWKLFYLQSYWSFCSRVQQPVLPIMWKMGLWEKEV